MVGLAVVLQADRSGEGTILDGRALQFESDDLPSVQLDLQAATTGNDDHPIPFAGRARLIARCADSADDPAVVVRP